MHMLGFRQYGGAEVLEHQRVPDPTPGPGQVLIRMQAAGLLRRPEAVRSVADPGLAGELGGSGVSRRRTAAVFAEVVDILAARPG